MLLRYKIGTNKQEISSYVFSTSAFQISELLFRNVNKFNRLSITIFLIGKKNMQYIQINL